MLDKYYFPGFTRKAVTFSIDDGDVINDKKFIDIVRPYGIRGTFNLCDASRMTAEEYRELYRGFEIANHVKYHPNIFDPGKSYPLTDEIFNKPEADTKKFYRHPEENNVYFSHGSYFNPEYFSDRNRWWFRITDPETYIELIDKADKELNEVFGKGSVRSFVWPFGKQAVFKPILEHVERIGYYGARDAGDPLSDFEMPKNRMDWKYCANDSTLLSAMEKFEAEEDDGRLKMFCFGVHSIDYENAKRWGDLLSFCEKYGRRDGDYYYASVGEIFDYEDAIEKLSVTDKEIYNGSSLPLYVKLNGKKTIIKPKEAIRRTL